MYHPGVRHLAAPGTGDGRDALSLSPLLVMRILPRHRGLGIRLPSTTWTGRPDRVAAAARPCRTASLANPALGRDGLRWERERPRRRDHGDDHGPPDRRRHRGRRRARGLSALRTDESLSTDSCGVGTIASVPPEGPLTVTLWLLPACLLIVGPYREVAVAALILVLLTTQLYFPYAYWDLVDMRPGAIAQLVIRNTVLIVLVAAAFPRIGWWARRPVRA